MIDLFRGFGCFISVLLVVIKKQIDKDLIKAKLPSMVVKRVQVREVLCIAIYNCCYFCPPIR